MEGMARSGNALRGVGFVKVVVVVVREWCGREEGVVVGSSGTGGIVNDH